MIQSIEEFNTLLIEQNVENVDLIMKAVETSRRLHEGQYRESGHPYIIHPLQVAETLVYMRLDTATIIAGLLHDSIEDTNVSRDELSREFGEHVSALVEGVTKISSVHPQKKSKAQLDSMRKMFFAMVKDIRVILIKLADKLNNMQTLEHKAADRVRAISQECLDIYAPLAHRLGISWMKAELEDLSLKHLQPGVYQHIKQYIHAKKEERRSFLENITQKIEEAARENALDIEIKTRAKHFYSIYNKMQSRGKNLHDIYDFLGVRIICRNLSDCYIMLGIIHTLWLPIENRFKDYIAMPKSNRYQSLHTTIMSDKGQILEVQIRTLDMEHTAEHGVAAHWLYKTSTAHNKTSSAHSSNNVPWDDHQQLAFIRDMQKLELADAQEYLDEMKQEILKDTIYVFTPKGDIVELPRGSTALDFAYHIHTEIGNRISGAKADSAIIPLRRELQNTQVVEIITNARVEPKLDWLQFARTRTARSKIRAYINKNNENYFVDRNVVVRNLKNSVELKAAVAQEASESSAATRSVQGLSSQAKPERAKTGSDADVRIRVGEERNMLVQFAECCSPRPGDEIAGYISRGRGIIVHKSDCSNFLALADVKERRIDVEWEGGIGRSAQHFFVTSLRNPTLLGTIEGIVHKNKGKILELNVDYNEDDMLVVACTAEFEAKQLETRALKTIRSLKDTIDLDIDEEYA